MSNSKSGECYGDSGDSRYNNNGNNGRSSDYESNRGRYNANNSYNKTDHLKKNIGTGDIKKISLENSNGTESAEDKIKKRQARLAKWKEKQKSAASTPEPGVAVAVAVAVNPANSKSPVNKAVSPVSALKPDAFSKTVIKPALKRIGRIGTNNKISAIKKPVLKRAFLDDDDEDDDDDEGVGKAVTKIQKKSSNFNGIKSEDKQSLVQENQIEDDPLDKFMTSLAKSETKSLASGNGVQEKEQLFEDEDLDEEEKNESIFDLLSKTSKNLNKAKIIPDLQPSKRPIFKKFYDSLKNPLTEDEIKEFALTNQITIKSMGNVRPINRFDQLGLTSTIMEILNELNFINPTPIQKIATPAIMSGQDIIGVAKTGSGKTLAFILPAMRHIVANLPQKNIKKTNQTPIALILTPTRELALQIFKDCKLFLKNLNLRGVCCYGGSNISSQIAELKRGAELIVSTPGRLIDLLTSNGGRVTNLSEVSFLVLDEADRMFDMGFEPQIMKIIKSTREDKQTCLFSATFAKKIEILARKILHHPVEIVVGGGRSIVSDTITQRVLLVKQEEKFWKLLKILGDFMNSELNNTKKILIFCSTQERCDQLLKQVLEKGYSCLSIHGGKEQVDRDGAIQDFKNGNVSILIATSVAARGLDVKDLSIVINYDAPNHLEDYVHRVGRTGRAGQLGIAYTFVTPEEDRSANDISKALIMSKNVVPKEIDDLAKAFKEKAKEGKVKYSFGFGGKGLEKLDEIRQNTKKLERKLHGEEDLPDNSQQEKSTAVSTPKVTNEGSHVDNNDNGEHDSSLPSDLDFEVIDGPIPNKLDSSQFHCKIPINDLPQKVRVLLSQEYPSIIEATSVSITTKGTFVAPDTSPPDGEEKLHIIVESDNKMDVIHAVSLIKESIISGIKENEEEEVRRSKQHAPGRYTVV